MSIASTAARGVAWNMFFGVGSRVIQLVGTLVLTRFIAPDAYGAVIAASLIVVTIGTFTSFAFGQYLIANKSDAEVSFQAMMLHVLLGIVTMAILVALRDPVARWIGSPAAAMFLPGFAVAHILERVRYVPERLLMRQLRFRAMATINGCCEILFTIVALAFAPRYGAFAILIATLVRATVSTTLFLIVSPRSQWLSVCALRIETMRALLAYGVPIMITAIADRAATRWDSLLMSKLFGPAVMARYNLSYSLAEMPIGHVAEHIGDVLMPTFALMEEKQRHAAVVRSAALMSLVVSPLGVGLGALAPVIVTTFFDARWAAMAPMLMVLSVMTVFRPMTWPAVAYLQAVSKTGLIMTVSVVRGVVVLALVATFGWIGGPVWACAGACLGYFLHTVVTVCVAGWATGLSIKHYLVGVARPLLACIPMFVAVSMLSQRFSALHVLPAVTLLAQIVVGAVVFVVSAYVFAGATLRELVRLAGKVVLRPQPQS
ncbi:MAG: oligosaccharide flippase family protein [Steroidobacteraceae bacterium]